MNDTLLFISQIDRFIVMIDRDLKIQKKEIKEDPVCICSGKCGLYAKKNLNILKNFYLMLQFLKMSFTFEDKDSKLKIKMREISTKIRCELFELLNFPFEDKEQYLIRCDELKKRNKLLTGLIAMVDE